MILSSILTLLQINLSYFLLCLSTSTMSAIFLRWPIRDIKKNHYCRFAVLFSYLQYFPLFKPKFFLLTLIFLKNSYFFKTQVFFKLNFEKKNSDVFKTQGFFSELRFFFKKWVFFSKSSLNNAHVIYLLTTIAGSKKMNKMALMINGFICFLFYFVPFTWNEHNASVHSCDIRELSP